MAKKSSIGIKHVCESCGSKFYDLGKEDPLCPKCGWSQLSGSRSDVSEFDDDEMVHSDENEGSEDNSSEDFDKAAEADAFSGNNYDDDDNGDDDEELASTDTDQIIEGDDSDDDDSEY